MSRRSHRRTLTRPQAQERERERGRERERARAKRTPFLWHAQARGDKLGGADATKAANQGLLACQGQAFGWLLLPFSGDLARK